MPNSNSSRYQARVDSTQQQRSSSRSVRISQHATGRLISQLISQRAAAEQAHPPAGPQDGSVAASISPDEDVMVEDSIPAAAGTAQEGMQPPVGILSSHSWVSVAASQRKPRGAAANRQAADANWRQQQDPKQWIGCLPARRALVQSEHAVIQDYVAERCRGVCCPTCGFNDLTQTTEAEAILVSFTGMVSHKLPIWRCNRCPSRAVFNLAPSMAGFYPGSPVDAVRLQSHDRAASAPPLWFRADLLSMLFFQRQHCKGTSHYGLSGALQRHFVAAGHWDERVKQERFQTSLGDALDSFAALQVNCADPQLLGLPPAGLADCCAVCSQGHMGYLQEQDAAHLLNGLPVMGPGAASSAGPLEQGQQSQQQSQQQPQQQQQQQQSQSAAEDLGAQSPQGVDSSVSTLQQSLLVSNPLPVFAPYTNPIVLLYCYIDGLMRVPHLSKAGSSKTSDAPAVLRMVPDSYLAKYDSLNPRPPRYQRKKDCHSFSADSVLGRSTKAFDIKGIVTMVCRHGFMLMAVNMLGSGERFVFAQCLLHLLMRTHNVWPYGSFYDINCRFGPHFRQVSEACGSSGLWPLPLASWGSNLRTPLPPFHRYMHTAACSEKHTLELHAALGMGSGEPTETANGYLGTQGSVLQYCRKPVRQVWLDVQMMGWEHKKAEDLPSLLLRTWHKAGLSQERYTKEQLRLAQRALTLGVPLDQVQVLAECPSVLSVDAVSDDMPWQAELAEATLMVEALSVEASRAAVVAQVLPSDLLTGSRACDSLHQRQQQLEDLLAENDLQQPWPLQSAELLDGAAQLCLYKVRSIQTTLGECSSLYCFTRWLQEHMGSARQTHKNIAKQLQRQRSKMSGLVRELLQWVCQLQRLSQHMLAVADQSADSVRQEALSSVGLAAGVEWPSRSSTATGQPSTPLSAVMQDLCSGLLPWEQQQSDGTLPLIEQRLALNALKLRAACTELNLVKFEVDSLMRSYRSQLQAVDTALQNNAEQQHAVAADVLWLQGQHADTQEAAAQPQHGEWQDAAAQPEQQQRESLASALQQQLFLSGRLLLLQHRREQLLAMCRKALVVADFIGQSSPQGPLPDQPMPAELAEAVADGLHFNDAEDSEADAGSVHSWDGEDYGADQDAGTDAAVAPDTGDGDVDMTDAAHTPAPQVADVVWDGRPPWRAQQGDMALLAGITARAGQLVDWQHAGFRLSSLSTLSPNQRLNDDIVNARIIQLNKSHSRWLLEGLNVPAVVCVPTWFMTKLMEQQVFDYSAAARFASQEALSAWGSHYGTILDCDLLVAPCFIRPYPEAPLTAVGHWIITVADLNSGEIIHYDPLMVSGAEEADAMQFFLCKEAANRFDVAQDTARALELANEEFWSIRPATEIPRQHDDVNCGVFALVFAECLCIGYPLRSCALNDATMDSARARLADLLLQGADDAKQFLVTGEHPFTEVD